MTRTRQRNRDTLPPAPEVTGTPDVDTPGPTQELWAFGGRRLSVRRKVVFAFYPVDEEGEPKDPSTPYLFGSKVSTMNSARIGRIYSIGVERQDGDRLTAHWPKYWTKDDTGRTVGTDIRLAWEVEDRAIKTEVQARGSEYPELEDIVNRLAAARSRVAPTGRTAFDAWLLNKLQKGAWRS